MGQPSVSLGNAETWTHEGLVKVGWREVGRHGRTTIGDAAGVGETRRGIDAVAILASTVDIMTQRSLSQFVDDLPQNGHLHINRHFDATPLIMGFGLLEPTLRPSARYCVKDESTAKWTTVPWSEYHKIYPKAKPTKGTLEVLATELDIHAEDGMMLHSRIVHVPPRILMKADASSTYVALDTAATALNHQNLRLLADRLKLLTLSDIPDNAACMLRCKKFIASTLPANVLYTPHCCAVHLLQRTLCAAVDMRKLVGDVHATWVTLRHPTNITTFEKVVRDFVEDKLLVVAGAPPDGMWNLHARGVLSHTILRVLDHTAGGIMKLSLDDLDVERGADRMAMYDSDNDEGGDMELDGDGGGRSGKYTARLRAASMSLKFLNGDWSGRLTHYCTGCCAGENESKANVASALCQIAFGFAGTEPSSSRWGSTTEALAEQCAGVLCHGVLPRILDNAGVRWKDIALEEDRLAEQRLRTHVPRPRRRRRRRGKGSMGSRLRLALRTMTTSGSC